MLLGRNVHVGCAYVCRSFGPPVRLLSREKERTMWAAHPDSEARLSRTAQAGRSLLRLGTAIVLFGFLVLLIALVGQGGGGADEPAPGVGNPGVGTQPVLVHGATSAGRVGRMLQRGWQGGSLPQPGGAAMTSDPA